MEKNRKISHKNENTTTSYSTSNINWVFFQNFKGKNLGTNLFIQMNFRVPKL